jgi:hypothetical protein
VAVKVWAIELPLPFEAPETPDWATVHEYVVPVTVPVNEMLVALPEQIVCEEGEAETVGVGLTVITTSMGVPMHPLAEGVMV